MTALIDAFNLVAEAWAGLAWAVAWQSTVMVGAFALVALGLRRSPPGARYWLWQLAAIKLLIMPLWSVSIALPAVSVRDAGLRQEATPLPRSDGEFGARSTDWRRTHGRDAGIDGPARQAGQGWLWIDSLSWQGWLLVGWVLAVAGQVAIIARQGSRLARLLVRADRACDPALGELVSELSSRIGLRRQPEVMIADGVGSPFVCGLWHTTLVLPRGLDRSLDPASLRAVLFHELTHIKRRDLVWDWIPTIARLLYFFHPAAHYIIYRSRLERELACDQAAMLLAGQGAAGYASTLVEAVSRTSGPPILRAALGSAHLDGS